MVTVFLLSMLIFTAFAAVLLFVGNDLKEAIPNKIIRIILRIIFIIGIVGIMIFSIFGLTYLHEVKGKDKKEYVK